MKKILLLLINFYQTKISPHTPPRCRYYPTCSQYSKESIERFGAIRGGWLSIKRILKCNRCFKGGIDYVPKTFSLFKHRHK